MSGIKVLYAILVTMTVSASADEEVIEIPYTVKNITLSMDDVVMCSTKKLDFDPRFNYYITAFIPKISHAMEHHMSMWSCRDPPVGSAYDQTHHPDVWECAPHAEHQEQFTRIDPCLGGEGHQFFAVNNEGQGTLYLRPGTGIEIGPETDVHSVSLAAHYTHVMEETGGQTAETGITVQVTKVPKDSDHIRKGSSIVSYIAGWIPPRSSGTVVGLIPVDIETRMHPQAVVFHTHIHSRVGSVSKVSADGETQLLLQVDPREGTYVDVTAVNMTIEKGDTINITCTFDNTDSDSILTIERTDMCVVSMIYDVDDGLPLFPLVKTYHYPPAFVPKNKNRVFLKHMDGEFDTKYFITDY